MSLPVLAAVGVLFMLFLLIAVALLAGRMLYWRGEWLELGRRHALMEDENESLREQIATLRRREHDAVGFRDRAVLHGVPPSQAPGLVPPGRHGRPWAGTPGQPLPRVQARDRLGAPGETQGGGGLPDYRRYDGETLAQTNGPVPPLPPYDDLG